MLYKMSFPSVSRPKVLPKVYNLKGRDREMMDETSEPFPFVPLPNSNNLKSQQREIIRKKINNATEENMEKTLGVTDLHTFLSKQPKTVTNSRMDDMINYTLRYKQLVATNNLLNKELTTLLGIEEKKKKELEDLMYKKTNMELHMNNLKIDINKMERKPSFTNLFKKK